MQSVKPSGQSDRVVLISLMIPFMMLVLNVSMFSVALPAIRSSLNIAVDEASWLVVAYALPFVMMMSFYGRLADEIGKRSLFAAVVLIFAGGTVVCLAARSKVALGTGRLIQGLGVAGVQPLCIAMIAERFPRHERGKALGTWGSVGPLADVLGPLSGGFLVDRVGWRVVFVPTLLVASAAFIILQILIPPSPSRVGYLRVFLRTFDWLGVALLFGATTLLVGFLSSRPISGIAPPGEWRLLVGAFAFAGLFIGWERYRERRGKRPFVDLALFSNKPFVLGSVCVGLRMFAMGGIVLLIPLYLADVYNSTATSIGTVLMTHALALLATLRIGGTLADRLRSRVPTMIGMGLQMAALVVEETGNHK